MKHLFCIFFVLTSFIATSQNGTVEGVVLDETNTPVANVNIYTQDKSYSTTTNANGDYRISLPADNAVTLIFSSLGFQSITVKNLILQTNEVFELNPVLKTKFEQITIIELNTVNQRSFEGVLTLSPEMIRKIPGAQPGVENLLKSLPGVNSNNELSTQYAVRGGNYDENLIYINEIEVYRPFLIRSGQQEGLSIVNTDLTRNVDFSAGGFQAKYGDKLSSVLNIEYKRPVETEIGVDASFLGASAYAQGTAFAKALTAIAGVRYRDNSLFIDSRKVESSSKPRFFDAQAYLTYAVNKDFEISFLGNIAINSYDFEPENSTVNFGTLTDPRVLTIFYEGEETDQYETYFGALKASWNTNEHLNLRLISSIYHTKEQEYFDILAQYAIGRPNTNIGSEDLGQADFTTGIGSELEHGRNNLDAIIATIEHKGTYTLASDKKVNDQLDWGVKYTIEDIKDRVREYNVLDSAGYFVRPPSEEIRNEQPYDSYSGPLTPYENIRSQNSIQINRFQAFTQYSARGYWGTNEIFWNLGIRAHVWNVHGDEIESSNQAVFSPRAQFAVKPEWKKINMLFRLSGGLYYQPPFYKELRNQLGEVNPDVKAQKSVHIVLGNEWSFKMWERPFTLNSELYYKGLSDVNTYTLENVRIRYNATNDATAYAYGLDLRLNGEFIPGTESWVSLGYLKTEENINDRGYIARPTDQRLKFAALFQDYVPNLKKLKMYLNLVYNSGLPGGSPNYADPYDYPFRLKSYFRTDVGVFYVFKDAQNPSTDKKWLNAFKELSLGAEIYNIFDAQNQISNIWVRDVSTSRQFAVPNYLTPRVFNLRLSAKF